MAKPKSPLTLEAERLLQKMPGANAKTLARRLSDEFGCTLESARTTIRYIRGTSGRRNARNATNIIPRTSDSEAAKVAKVPPTQLPESLAESWEPVELQPKIALILSDTHIPYHDQRALEAALKHAEKYAVDHIILNGDIADFYSISRHQKDPRKRGIKKEIAAVCQFLDHLRERFQSAKIVYKFGNHEERWEAWVWNHAPEVADCEQMLLSEWLKLQERGIKFVAQQQPVMCGKLPVFHGHELGRSGIANPVNPARGAFLRTHHTVLVGHSHQSSGHADTNVWHDETFVWSTGCLCHLNPEWLRVNRWNHGFAMVECDDDGFNVDNYRISKDYKVRKS